MTGPQWRLKQVKAIFQPMPKTWPPTNVALIYDRINTQHGGAELVLQAIHQIFPTATLFGSVVDLKTALWARSFSKIVPSWLQTLPGAPALHRWLAQCMPLAFELFDLQSYDLVISVTSAEAKGVLTLPGQLHVCYVLAPPRYLYHQKTELMQAQLLTRLPGIKQLALLALNYLRWWDQAAIHRPDVLIPLSEKVTQQLKTLYALPPKTIDPVLYPPVSTPIAELEIADAFPEALLKLGLSPDKPFFLQVGRLVAYKKTQLSLEAAEKNHQDLVIVGSGPELPRLLWTLKHKKSTDHTTIAVLGAVDQLLLKQLYQRCATVLAPGEEDFGLTALEANSYGKPVILYEKSGSAEVIQHKKHGLHLKKQTVAELRTAMDVALTQTWTPKLLRQNAAKYDTSIFVTAFEQRLQAHWQHNQHRKK